MNDSSISPYSNDAELYDCFRTLVAQIEAADPSTTETLLKSKIAIRFSLTEPKAEMMLDARKRPFHITYGPSTIKPTLDITLTTQTLHEILLGQLPLTKALGGKRIKPKGHVWKVITLAPLFDKAKDIYPSVLADCAK